MLCIVANDGCDSAVEHECRSIITSASVRRIIRCTIGLFNGCPGGHFAPVPGVSV